MISDFKQELKSKYKPLAQPDKDAILEHLDMKSSSQETSKEFTAK